MLTVIEGAHAGEKALYIDGRIRVASGSAWADEINDNRLFSLPEYKGEDHNACGKYSKCRFLIAYTP